MVYIIVHSVINTKGNNEEANARIIGCYSQESIAIKQAEEWIQNTRTSDVSVKRITDTQWYFWYSEHGKTYGGYIEVVGSELDEQAI